MEETSEENDEEGKDHKGITKVQKAHEGAVFGIFIDQRGH